MLFSISTFDLNDSVPLLAILSFNMLLSKFLFVTATPYLILLLPWFSKFE